MSKKVSCISVIILINLFYACSNNVPVKNDDNDIINIQQQADSLASAKIDSAYKAIQQQCDTATKYHLPLLVDSLLQVKK